MPVLDWSEKELVILKEGRESVFFDQKLIPKNAEKGDVLRLYHGRKKDGVELFLVPIGDKLRICLLKDTVEIPLSIFQVHKPVIRTIAVDLKATVKRWNAICEFEWEYDNQENEKQKNHHL